MPTCTFKSLEILTKLYCATVIQLRIQRQSKEGEEAGCKIRIDYFLLIHVRGREEKLEISVGKRKACIDFSLISHTDQREVFNCSLMLSFPFLSFPLFPFS